MLNNLIGSKITKVDTNINIFASINDQGSYTFETPTTIYFYDYILNIYNPFRIEGLGKDLKLSTIENLLVEGFSETSIEIVLYLGQSIRLVVDLRDESYNGPEAMSLYGPDGLIVIWS